MRVDIILRVSCVKLARYVPSVKTTIWLWKQAVERCYTQSSPHKETLMMAFKYRSLFLMGIRILLSLVCLSLNPSRAGTLDSECTRHLSLPYLPACHATNHDLPPDQPWVDQEEGRRNAHHGDATSLQPNLTEGHPLDGGDPSPPKNTRTIDNHSIPWLRNIIRFLKPLLKR